MTEQDLLQQALAAGECNLDEISLSDCDYECFGGNSVLNTLTVVPRFSQQLVHPLRVRSLASELPSDMTGSFIVFFTV